MTPAICAEGRDDHHPEKLASFASRAFIPQAGALFSDPRQTSEQFIRVSLMVLELPESFYSPFDQFRNFCRLAGCQSALGNRVQDCRARRHRVGWAFDLGQVERNRTVTPHWRNPIEDDLCRCHIALACGVHNSGDGRPLQPDYIDDPSTALDTLLDYVAANSHNAQERW